MAKDYSGNIEQQKEEMEVLQSVYDKDFQIEDETPTFSIVIHIGENEGEEATLVVSYNLEYPSSGPPVFHLSVPWLGNKEKQKLTQILNEVYLEHIGEPVVYFWVEELRKELEKLRPETMTVVQDAVINLDEIKNAEVPEENYEADVVLEEDSWKTKKTAAAKAPVIHTGDPFTDRKSTFQAHVAKVSSVDEVKAVLAQLYTNKKIANATHNMYAYRIFKDENSTAGIQDCDDDGETHAGGRMLHLLQILDVKNVLVVVSRWFGGIQLHGDRFKHINNVARELLDKQGYISHIKTNNTRKASTKK